MSYSNNFTMDKGDICCDYPVNHLNDYLKTNGFDLPKGFFNTYLNEIVDYVRDFHDLCFEWVNRLDLIHDNFDEEYWKYFINDGLTFHDDWDLPDYTDCVDNDEKLTLNDFWNKEDFDEYIETKNKVNDYKKTKEKFSGVMNEYQKLGWKEVV